MSRSQASAEALAGPAGARAFDDLDAMLAAVEADPDLKRLVETPLIMSLFAFSYRDQGDEADEQQTAHPPVA